MSKKDKKQSSGSGALLLSVALGAALAAGAGYYATHKEEIDKEAKKKIDELSKLFKETKKQIEPKVKDVWGVVSKEYIEKYIDLRATLLRALEDERVKNAGVLLKENYDTIVEGIVARARKAGILDAATQRKLEKLFKMDWEQVKEVMFTSAEVAATVTKKGINKASKEIKKVSKQIKSTKKTPAKKTSAKKTTTKKSPTKKAATKKSTTKKTTDKKSHTKKK